MNIVILAGGTGSIALQRGLYDLIDANFDGVDTKVIVNAYDNGLSTGAVRQVMGGQILGPSDVRKNQTTRLLLEDPESPWHRFLGIRFTAQSSEAKDFCAREINKLREALTEKKSVAEAEFAVRTLYRALDVYFSVPVATKIDYTDFSLANIIYAGLARANKNSLRAAASHMAELMGIKDNVLLNDDTSLFLGAITESGRRITDEGDIVSWGNTEDPFVDIFFTDANGKPSRPALCDEAWDALINADLIILSSGTQWSSLIPTYESLLFREAMHKVAEIGRAKVLMVMNREPDKDSPGQGASEIIELVGSRYFADKQLHVLVDINADPIMRDISDEAEDIAAGIYPFVGLDHASTPVFERKVHDPALLAKAVSETYFGDYLKSDFFMFDYDDTLVGRGNTTPKASTFNVNGVAGLSLLGKVAICTGNSIKAVNLRTRNAARTFKMLRLPRVTDPMIVFADGGVNKYLYNPIITGYSNVDDDDAIRSIFVECVNPDAVIPETGKHSISAIMASLINNGITLSKIENRGGAMITIRPVDSEYRKALTNFVQLLTKGSGLLVREAGRSTIEILNPKLTKVDAVRHVKKTLNPASITYVGDEFKSGGNDECIKSVEGVKCLEVKNPAQTAFFISTLLNSL